MARITPPYDEEPIDPAAILRLGTIASIDLQSGEVEVDTGEVRTAPIPFSTSRAGNTRIWSPPSVGEQVMLLCPGGDIEGAVALGAIAQNAFPLAGNTLRELIAFRDGAVLAYDPEGHRLDITLPEGATFAINANGGIAIEGDVAVTGKITATDDVLADGTSLKSHKHGGVQTGTSPTDVPL